MKKLLWLPVVLLFSSCAYMTARWSIFEEPVNGDRARVRFVAASDLVLVQAIPGKNQVDWETPGAGVVFGNFGLLPSGFRDRSLGIPPGPSEGRMAEFYVKAGEPITFKTQGNSIVTGYHKECHQEYVDPKNYVKDKRTKTVCNDVAEYDSCSTVTSFTPQRNTDYEAVYSEEDVSHCSIDIYAIDARGNRI